MNISRNFSAVLDITHKAHSIASKQFSLYTDGRRTPENRLAAGVKWKAHRAVRSLLKAELDFSCAERMQYIINL